jgi:hypothetical protein
MREWARTGALRWLPTVRMLSAKVWEHRHRAIVALVWLHALAFGAYALLGDAAPAHALGEAGLIAALALAASLPLRRVQVRAAIATAGLLTASAVLVHLSGGTIEAHFHFFVVLAVVTLYQDWLPFLLGVGYVVVHHGVVGVLHPSSVLMTSSRVSAGTSSPSC